MAHFESAALICIFNTYKLKPMKKNLLTFVILSFSLLLGSCIKCSRDQPLDSNLASCFFKVGSYFIYNDSIDHIIDSEYVYQYGFERGQGAGSYTQANCNYPADWVYMSQSSFRNGLIFDSIHSLSSSLKTMNMYDSKGYIYFIRNRYNYTEIPEMVYSTSSDTLMYRNFSVGGKVYPTVYESLIPVYIKQNSDTIPCSFYFAPNYGIIKKVEHRPSGDVSWDLIRSHIVN